MRVVFGIACGISLTLVVWIMWKPALGWAFDSLRRTKGYMLSDTGVNTVFDQTYCGRCINDMRETL